ncbi:acid-sensing ion channel 5-like [Antedon mediterranea]|uniref:acid-sensing ion channel 5-like n=1 Tax=Antedon mediterranea TaxID=105859 RepID=UPI003AF87CF0
MVEDDLDVDFASKTTMHGVQRLVEERPRSYKMLWVVIIVASVGFCSWEVQKRISNYFEYNVNTEITVKFSNNLTFPAVTICNFNRYRLSQITEDEFSYLTCLADNEYKVCKEELKAPFNSSEFTNRAGFDLDANTLWTCNFRHQACGVQNFTSVVTEYGRCWTFNGDSESAVYQIQPGFGNGLHVVINVDQEDYTEHFGFGYLSMDAGLRVMVHPQNTPPLVYGSGFAIGTGMHAYTDISVTKFKNLEEPWGECKEGQTLEYYDTYSYDNCINECLLKLHVKRCECRPDSLLGPFRICGLEEKDLKCLNEVFIDITNGEVECDCAIECNDLTYSTKLSYGSIPSYSIAKETEEKFNATAAFIKDNVVVMDVYYSYLSTQVFTQTKAMTSSALLSDIGGQLGLFVGVSFITIIEFMEYFTLKFKFFLKSKKGNRSTNKSRNENGNELNSRT